MRLSFALLLLVPVLHAQTQDAYVPFKPIDKDTLLHFSPFGIKITSIKNYFPFSEAKRWTPYQSAYFARSRQNNRAVFEDSITTGIKKYSVIKEEENEKYRMVLYTNSIYSDFFSEGIWIAIYNKQKEQWKKYYTGIEQEEPLLVKWYSELPLIKNDSTLQIEAALFQLLEQPSLPVGFPKHLLIKDGLVVEFDLNRISLDSDGDGLTDLVERRMMLDPYNKDTDGDGIDDKEDANPRYHVTPDSSTVIYEALLAGKWNRPNAEFSFIPDTLFAYRHANKSRQSFFMPGMIITNNPSIQAIDVPDQQLLIFSAEEYKTYKKKYWNNFTEHYISRLYKVDDQQDTYKLDVGSQNGSRTYLLIRVKGGWKCQVISSLII